MLRDRGIITACLVLYALGMMMASLSHSYAHQTGASVPSDIISYGVVCTADGETESAEQHCPFCRLTDASIDIAPINLTPHIAFAFTAFQHSEKQIIQALDLKRSTPTRGPPHLL